MGKLPQLQQHLVYCIVQVENKENNVWKLFSDGL